MTTKPAQGHRVATIALTSCSKECPFFKAIPGLGHDDDSCKCIKADKFIHDYRSDYNGPFPEFCPLKEEYEHKKVHCLNIDNSCDYRTWNWRCKRPKLDCASQKVV